MKVEIDADELATLRAENRRLRAREAELLEANTKLVEDRRRTLPKATAAAYRALADAIEAGPDTSRGGCVRAFFGVAGQQLGAVPHVPSDEVVRFRVRLVVEEVFELIESAFGFAMPPGLREGGAETGADQRVFDMAKGLAHRIVDTAPIRMNLPAFIDATTDIDYVIEGARVAFGVDGEPIWAEVHAKNMAKAGGPRAPDGKLLKPQGWTPPDVAALLRAQGWSEAA